MKKMAKFSFLKRKEQVAIFLFFSLFCLRSLFFEKREKERERERKREKEKKCH